MELLILLAFASGLVLCVVLNLSVLYALTAGFFLFFLFSLYKGNSVQETIRTCLSGVWTVRIILIAFILIGMLTAFWRAAGTIPAIIAYASALINPRVMVLLTFLLNSLVSFMTGTAFGTSATMGVICYSIACSMGIPPAIAGGAMLSGAYFGDRCSPVSTSALLTAEITNTNIYTNIRYMMKTALVPFVLSCLIFLTLGFYSAELGTAELGTVLDSHFWELGTVLDSHSNGAELDVTSLFLREFQLGFLPLLPAITIFLLASFRIDVKKTMATSIVVALFVYLFYQHGTLAEAFRYMILGYKAKDPELHALIDGGGIISMLRAGAIVSISASYKGLFQLTGLLKPMETVVQKLGQRFSTFGVLLPITTFICMIACNQTLSIMLGNELLTPLEKDNQRRAIYLENSSVVVAVLIPWSIAGAVPLSTCGAPTISLVFCCYLYLVPLWTLIRSEKWKSSIL